jgi:hypothetical protein
MAVFRCTWCSAIHQFAVQRNGLLKLQLTFVWLHAYKPGKAPVQLPGETASG